MKGINLYHLIYSAVIVVGIVGSTAFGDTLLISELKTGLVPEKGYFLLEPSNDAKQPFIVKATHFKLQGAVQDKIVGRYLFGALIRNGGSLSLRGCYLFVFGRGGITYDIAECSMVADDRITAESLREKVISARRNLSEMEDRRDSAKSDNGIPVRSKKNVKRQIVEEEVANLEREIELVKTDLKNLMNERKLSQVESDRFASIWVSNWRSIGTLMAIRDKLPKNNHSKIIGALKNEYDNIRNELLNYGYDLDLLPSGVNRLYEGYHGDTESF